MVVVRYLAVLLNEVHVPATILFKQREQKQRIMITIKEVWKDVKGFAGYYQVSNLGRVKSLKYNKTRFLKKEIAKGKYNRVTLSKENKTTRFQVHRLVASHFISNPNNKPCVNHKDGNGFNNSVENLEWCTYSENERHSYDVLGKINTNRKLTKSTAEFIRAIAIKGRGGNIKSLSDEYDVNISVIYNIINNKHYV